MIHLLPTFHGLTGEDPNKHLKEFHVVCSSVKPIGISIEQVKLKAFPFSLADNAKEWLYYLPSGTNTIWNEMNKVFLEKYFPSSKATTIRKEICSIRQEGGETLMNIGNDSRDFVLHAHITKLVNLFSSNILRRVYYEGSKYDWCYWWGSLGW